MITFILVVAVGIGVFVFVKNNPNKTKQIDTAAKDLGSKLADEARALREKASKK